jgi:multimeric flavodoxin WrbA
MAAAGADGVPIVSLSADPAAARAAFLAADEVLVAFPLYADFVPGILKEFLDSLIGLETGALRGKRVAWIVHSGFPESRQSETAAAWLPRATARLGMECAGVLVKGGSEGFRMMPPQMTSVARRQFAAAGHSLVSTGSFDQSLALSLAHPSKIGFLRLGVMAVMKAMGLADGYWNMMLKKHGAMARRFDAPYGKAFQGQAASEEADKDD